MLHINLFKNKCKINKCNLQEPMNEPNMDATQRIKANK